MTRFIPGSAQLVLKIFKTIQLDLVLRFLLERLGHRGFNLETAKSKDVGLEFSGQAEVSPLRINHLKRQKHRDGKV